MSTLRASILSLIFGLVCIIPIACNKEEPKFGPPKIKEQTVQDLPRDKDGWVTDKDLEDWDKETPTDSLGNIAFTKDELKGMKLFMQKCNKCHPGGEKGKGPSLKEQKIPDFLIHFQIRNGFGDMPAFKQEEVAKEDVRRIIQFLKLLRRNNNS